MGVVAVWPDGGCLGGHRCLAVPRVRSCLSLLPDRSSHLLPPAAGAQSPWDARARCSSRRAGWSQAGPDSRRGLVSQEAAVRWGATGTRQSGGLKRRRGFGQGRVLTTWWAQCGARRMGWRQRRGPAGDEGRRAKKVATEAACQRQGSTMMPAGVPRRAKVISHRQGRGVLSALRRQRARRRLARSAARRQEGSGEGRLARADDSVQAQRVSTAPSW